MRLKTFLYYLPFFKYNLFVEGLSFENNKINMIPNKAVKVIKSLIASINSFGKEFDILNNLLFINLVFISIKKKSIISHGLSGTN